MAVFISHTSHCLCYPDTAQKRSATWELKSMSKGLLESANAGCKFSFLDEVKDDNISQAQLGKAHSHAVGFAE